MTSALSSVRVGLQQRVIPSYRAAFFDALAASLPAGLSVFAGQPLPFEGIEPVESLQVAQYVSARNRCFSHPGSSLFLCWQDGLIDWLESWQPHVLVMEANPRYLATRRAISWMHHRQRKVIGWGLGAPPLGGLFGWLRRWERTSLLSSLDAIIAYSRQGEREYRQLGIPASRVYVASNAVSPAPASTPPQRPARWDSQPTILFVGRLQERKRLDLLLYACSRLPNNIQPRLVIVGDGPARAKIEDLARLVYPAAEFVGARHGADLEPYFAQADLFILPGTGGLAIQQAMAHALPVIVARGDGSQDDLVRPENGWQVPPDDLPVLVEVLSRALSDPACLRQMGSASYRIVAREINLDRMVEVFLGAIRDVLSTSPEDQR